MGEKSRLCDLLHKTGSSSGTKHAIDYHLSSNWIKDRNEKFGFKEGEDFIVITGSPKKGSADFNLTPQIDYHLTLDMAKELSMVERNDKG